MVKVNKKGLAEILGVKVTYIKILQNRGTLEGKLLDVGYQLIDKKIEGEVGKQQTFYYLDEFVESIDADDFNILMDNLISIW